MIKPSLQVKPPADFVEYQAHNIEQSFAKAFEETVRNHSTKIAIKSGTQTLTYEAFNQAANHIAHEVIEMRPPRPFKGTHSSDLSFFEKTAEPIAVFMDQSIEAIAAVFALLKAGKIFVLLDPNDPDTRNRYILQHVPSMLILTQEKYRDRVQQIGPAGSEHISINKLECDSRFGNPGLQIEPSCPTLLIYTSGSTGQPKGVILIVS
jgi:acyl-CoA synthetase (AMP-forming)/AMP-acid ligase II